VVDEVLEDLADKVVKEPDEFMEENTDNLGLVEVNSEEMEAGGVPMEVEGSAAVPEVKERGEDAKVNDNEERRNIFSVMEVVEPAGMKLVGAALIKEVVHSPTRASPRLAGVVAEHTLVRAERLIQSKNLECNKGTFQGDFLDQTMVHVV